MKRVAWLLVALFLLLSAGLSLRAYAVSPSPIPEEREEKMVKGIRVKGETVCLFQSGTADVKKAITIGDVLLVYRESKKQDVKEVGKIKVLSYVGDDYMRGEVVEGELQAGDIAKKEGVAGLVISSDDKCKEEKTLQPALKMRK
jgi:NADH:ubiquinone oxidoreductase subunit K